MSSEGLGGVAHNSPPVVVASVDAARKRKAALDAKIAAALDES